MHDLPHQAWPLFTMLLHHRSLLRSSRNTAKVNTAKYYGRHCNVQPNIAAKTSLPGRRAAPNLSGKRFLKEFNTHEGTYSSESFSERCPQFSFEKQSIATEHATPGFRGKHWQVAVFATIPEASYARVGIADHGITIGTYSWRAEGFEADWSQSIIELTSNGMQRKRPGAVTGSR